MGPSGWLELTLDYRSNLRCIGCTACDERGGELSIEDVGQWLRWGRHRGLQNLWLGGGEPTLRPDLGKIVRFARRVGYQHVLLQTNGMRLAHARYADAVIAAGVDTVSLNVKSANAAIHDQLSGRQGAFDLLEQAVEVLSTRSVTVVADVLLTRRTLPGLSDTVQWFAERGVSRFWLWLLSATDRADHDVLAEIPRPEDIAEPLTRAAQTAKECGVTLKSLHTPRCWLPSELHALVGSAAELDLWVVNPGERTPVKLEHSAMEGGSWLADCAQCDAKPRCSGPRKETIDRFGTAPFRPIRNAISNAFHYVLDPVSRPWPKGAPCPRLAGPDVTENARLLYIHQDGKLTGASTASKDFTSDQIQAIKNVTGQLYLDISTKDAPTDFAQDLQQLERDPICLQCPRHGRCGGAFTPVEGQPFSRDDERVQRRVKALRGDVLDLGAGEGPYLETLAEHVASDRIRYTAVEPDANHAEALQRRAPWADVCIMEAETFDPPPKSLDHVLILRSYNHLHSPEKVLKTTVRALRDGGQLIVVDNEAFALVRTARQADRAESGSAIFEHTRNDGAKEHVALIEALGLPLRLVERQDVGPTTSNQWMVVWRVDRRRGRSTNPPDPLPTGAWSPQSEVAFTPARFETWFAATCARDLAQRGWHVVDVHGAGPWEIAIELRRWTDGRSHKVKLRRRSDALGAAIRTRTFDLLHSPLMAAAGMDAMHAIADALAAVEEGVRFTGPTPQGAFAQAPGSTSAALNLAIPGECGQRCSFCGIREELKVGPAAPAGLVHALRRDISKNAADGVRILRINGIEPLAAPYIWELLEHASDEGFEEFHVLSTFRTLKDHSDVEKLLDLMPQRYRFYLPIYGSRADIHDAVTGRKGSFEEVMAAWSELRQCMTSRGHWNGVGQIVVTTVMNATNANDMHALALLLGDRARAWNVHLPFPNTGSAQDPYFEAALSMSDAIEKAAPAAYWPAFHFAVGEILPCVLWRHQKRTGHELVTPQSLSARQAELSGTFYESAGFAHSLADGKSIAFSAATVPCPHVGQCALARACPAKVYEAYDRRFGRDELQPVFARDLPTSIRQFLGP